ncbi:hypothetical protein BCF59_0101 [Mycoplasmopsis mustelae]|uniref:Lipoprotein n=1 Tax=Mycoplasmopsis mustelae TaxID=171289 RepID=A0A4R7UE81_9BACT|nr:hypothetical protein [Mycoplasmopsis mustelae]TDV24153.1 hypothetical protein BCF59_0101 [Mycoplasmopsis mustelae]
MKYKLIKRFLITSLVASPLPFTAVSCLYQNNPTIRYAEDFANENGFIIKDRVADQKIQQLVEFENKLYNSNFLQYTFANVSLRLKQSTLTIDNSHLLKKITNLFKTEGNGVELNQEKLKLIENQTKKIQELLKTYQTRNNATIPEVEDIIARNQSEIDNIKSQNEKIIEKLKEYQNLQGSKKTVTEMLYHKYSSKETTPADNLEQEIISIFNSLKEVEFYEITNLSLVITKDKVMKIVENFIKDTPFAAGLNYVANASSADLNNFEPFSKLINYIKSTGTFEVKINDKIPGNTILSSLLSKILNKTKILDNNVSYKQIDANKILTDIWTEFYNAYPTYRLENDESNNKNLENDKKGISFGFGPIYLIYGFSPTDRITSNTQENQDYKVFNIKLTDEQQKQFLGNPHLYLLKHPDILFYRTINNANQEIKKDNESITKNNETIELKIKSINELKAQLNKEPNNEKIKNQIKKEEKIVNILKNSIRTLGQRIKQNTHSINFYNTIIPKVKEALLQLDNPNLTVEQKKQYQDIIDQFKANSIISADTKRLNELITEKFDDAKTSQYSLADLIAKLLFLNKVYKAQSVRGYRLNGNRKQLTYWVEFYNYKEAKWKLFDVYDLFKTLKTNKNANINDFIFDSLGDKFENLTNSNSELKK